jgi:hypothetical protein
LTMDKNVGTAHLTDAELFGLALPPVGEPEALPAHLSECGACGRALQNWKAAVRDLARESAGPIDRRTPAQWQEAEERTLALIHGARVGRRFPLRWAAGLAAAVLVAVMLLPGRGLRAPAPASLGASPAVEAAELSALDRADDALLRDVNLLASSDSSGVWNAFAAEPGELSAVEKKRL